LTQGGFVEIARLIGALSVAIISMSVVTYALAVPRLQQWLASNIKSISAKKDDLQKKMRQEGVTITDVESDLKAIDKERETIEKDVSRLSWKIVVGIPALCEFVAMLFVFLVLNFSLGQDVYFLLSSFVLSLLAFFHLLLSLRSIEQTVLKMGQKGIE
jgi:hypothetical protein